MIGQTISHYRILEKLGEGGMGVVYKAEDTVLGRAVAIKFLPESLAADPDDIARFEREAKLLASLNHPNIAAIHGLENADEKRFLVLELVEGETLADRLRRGRIPVDETLSVCLQIATGVEAAHEQGVIHRDLKPSNVKITADGKVKVLDFGLAKAQHVQDSELDLSQSPTVPFEKTQAGMILGTAAYMSPEQARGKPLDKRTDIWSFGCLLFEVLTGQRAFGGETVSDSIASVLQSEPSWDLLPAQTPTSIRRLLMRCLQKDPVRRLRDIGDARIELEEALAEGTKGPAELPRATKPPGMRTWGTWALGFVAILATAIALWSWNMIRSASIDELSVARFAIDLPQDQYLGMDFPPVALSPDGQLLVYAAKIDNQSRLYLRSLDEFEAHPLPGTEGGADPFFSPDGQWVGFYADGKIKKVSVAGGTPLTICDAPFVGPGASWGPDDTIIFPAREASGLLRVSAAGGVPEALIEPERARGEIAYRRPHFMPDGKSVLFTVQATEGPRIAIMSIETGERRSLITGSTMAMFLPPGHLVFSQSSDIRIAAFDPVRLELTGNPIPVLDGVYSRTVYGVRLGFFALSRTGSLVYVPGSAAAAGNTIAWFDREGRITPVTDDRGPFRYPRLSPDGKWIAVTTEDESNTIDVWIYDTVRGSRTRLTFIGNNVLPVWTPDSKRVVFSSNRSGAMSLHWKSADGSGEAEQLLERENSQFPETWSLDGRILAFTEYAPGTNGDIWMLHLDGDRTPVPFLVTPYTERSPRFSPNGRWVAYVSNESGRYEIYVRPYPGPGGKWLISTDGGQGPLWSSDGKTLFYRHGNSMMAVAVRTEPEFVAGKPERLFTGGFDICPAGIQNSDMTSDGQRFLMVTSSQEAAPSRMNVVLNWIEELDKDLQ